MYRLQDSSASPERPQIAIGPGGKDHEPLGGRNALQALGSPFAGSQSRRSIVQYFREKVGSCSKLRLVYLWKARKAMRGVRTPSF